MLGQMAIRAKRQEILERIISLLVSANLVVDVRVLYLAAPLTSPFVPLQGLLHQETADSSTFTSLSSTRTSFLNGCPR